MATEVIMPKVDMVMDTGTFVEWLKNEGDRIEKGEPLFIVLTDKANIEIEAGSVGVCAPEVTAAAQIRIEPNDVVMSVAQHVRQDRSYITSMAGDKNSHAWGRPSSVKDPS